MNCHLRLLFLRDESKKSRAARRGESAEKRCFGTKLRFDGERGTVFGRRTAQRRSSHGPEAFVARPKGDRCTAQRRTAHGPRSLTGIRDGAAPAWSPTGAKHCSSLCSQSEGREDESAATAEFVALFAIGSSPSLCEQSELQCWRRKVINTVGAPVREVLIEYYHKLDRNNSGCAILRILHIRLTLFYRRFFSSSIIRPSSE